ncbi:peptidase S1 [Roseibacterium sp. SDUM158017]|uniref:peptidase S1 n=1 Tax=Roseicyclus salinarum TaxID=3036773 RepID=UPI002415192F|nr:peptidase S1 [Roseibacterium sp. SDUM158017]MDG4650040.1 peptidase S1 [Roseibacterium sp. SDUM158017]
MKIARRLLAGAGLAAMSLSLSAAAATACPSYNNPTVFGSANVPANFMPDPWVRNVTAGGTVSLQGCGFSWPGFVISRPDFRFQYTGTSPTGQLTIALEARSNVDTILLVNAPDGTWHFNDDYRGTNSAITFTNPMQGQYDIWTGSYYRSSNNPAQLLVTELSY